MISVVVPTLNSATQLPRCFESLIGGAVRGIVREVIAADGGSSDETLAIADGAGARIVSAGRTRGEQMAAGAAAARTDWLLFLDPRTALGRGWENEAQAFILREMPERPRAAAFRFALDDFEPRARRLETVIGLRAGLLGQACAGQGLLISKRFYQRLGGHRPHALEDIDLARRIGRTRLVRLRSRAINTSETKRDRQRFALGVLHAMLLPKRLVALFAR